MSQPLSSLSASKQNTRFTPVKPYKTSSTYYSTEFARRSVLIMDSLHNRPSTSESDEFHDTLTHGLNSPVSYPYAGSNGASPRKQQSPLKTESLEIEPGSETNTTVSLRESTIRFNEGLTRAMGSGGTDAQLNESVLHHKADDTTVNSVRMFAARSHQDAGEAADDTEITLSMDDKMLGDETQGDLSTISAIPTDLTRFANLRTSPTKTPRPESWSPSKQLRVSGTPGTVQRPLHLVSRRAPSSSEVDDDATPRRSYNTSDSPTDLMNFTGQSNIFIPPPSSGPRSNFRRSPSGRASAFPIRVNPSPSHRSQASVDRERLAGGSTWSPNKQPTESYFPPASVQATPANKRHSMMGALPPNGHNSLDLLDIDLEPLATPRSIPTVTPRELESLRSSLSSRISALEATLSGKEAEVLALKRSVTDAEVRVGKTSEDLQNERALRETVEAEKNELERRSREMEGVLREVKQNAFVEEREREKLRRQVEDSERKAEECEVKILELNASLQTLRDSKFATPSPQKLGDAGVPATPNGVGDIDAAVKSATENVARELHALYKGKHERKVADLKISYEKRWLKQVDQLRGELKTAQDEVMKLQTERDATLSGVIPSHQLARENERAADAAAAAAAAMVETLEGQLRRSRVEAENLRSELELERLEKGDLVAQVDLFLQMSQEQEQARRVVAAPLPETPSPPTAEKSHAVWNVPGNASDSNGAYASPSKNRGAPGINGANGVHGANGNVGHANAAAATTTTSTTTTSNGTGGGRPRPMSMLQPPRGGKFSAIPGPAESRLKAPTTNRGGIMENIARMGAGGR